VTIQAESLEQASALDQAANAFVELRPRLFGIAYRMLGLARYPFPCDLDNRRRQF
jgi:hypothetical protein